MTTTEDSIRGPHPIRQRHPDQGGQPAFSIELELTLHRALSLATERDHTYATLEHLLLALIDDAVASALMKDCKVDLHALKVKVTNYIDNELKTLTVKDGRDASLTPALLRVAQRAVSRVQDLGGDAVTGADLLLAIFDETESPAVWLLAEQRLTRQQASDFVVRLNHQGAPRSPIQPVIITRPKKRGKIRGN